MEDLIVDEKHIGLFPEDLLCKLKCLHVRLDESAAIVSLDDFLHRFHAIKVLVIKENDDFWKDPSDEFENGMKVVITGINQRRDLKQILKGESSNTNNNTQAIELTQLRTLELRSLPQLTSFCTGDLHFEKVRARFL